MFSCWSSQIAAQGVSFVQVWLFDNRPFDCVTGAIIHLMYLERIASCECLRWLKESLQVVVVYIQMYIIYIITSFKRQRNLGPPRLRVERIYPWLIINCNTRAHFASLVVVQ